MRKNLNDLFETIEKIRVEKYPHLPKDMVEEIFLLEADNIENRSIVKKNLNRIINKYIGKEVE